MKRVGLLAVVVAVSWAVAPIGMSSTAGATGDLPDLHVRLIHWDPEGWPPPCSLRIWTIIENEGTADAGEFFAGISFADEPLVKQRIAGLAAGATVQVGGSVRKYDNSYAVTRVILDPHNRVHESDEVDNHMENDADFYC